MTCHPCVKESTHQLSPVLTAPVQQWYLTGNPDVQRHEVPVPWYGIKVGPNYVNTLGLTFDGALLIALLVMGPAILTGRRVVRAALQLTGIVFGFYLFWQTLDTSAVGATLVAGATAILVVLGSRRAARNSPTLHAMGIGLAIFLSFYICVALADWASLLLH